MQNDKTVKCHMKFVLKFRQHKNRENMSGFFIGKIFYFISVNVFSIKFQLNVYEFLINIILIIFVFISHKNFVQIKNSFEFASGFFSLF